MSGLRFEARLRRGGFGLEAGFEVARGECLAMVGPNGAGKSTCLELVAGLLAPDSGTIALDGETLFDSARRVSLPPARRRVAWVPRGAALFPHLDVRANVAYGPRARGASGVEAARAADRWLERLGAAAIAASAPATLSDGQRQRVSLARALASSPRALLLDEPFGALDVGAGELVRGELRAVLAELGLPVVLVTHEALDAQALGHRVAVIESGRITQSGTWEDLVREPRSAFAGALTGINLHHATLAPGEGLREARAGDVVFHVVSALAAGRVQLAYAPGDVMLARERPAGSAQNVFAARLVAVTPAGDRLRLRLDTGVAVTAEITREGLASLQASSGDRIWMALKATAIRVYP